MQLIGLTGGIGSGKSTVAKIFKELGYQIISADLLAKETLQKTEIIEQLVLAFGKQIKKEGKINTTLLAKRVFQNQKSVQTINSITHPIIRAKFLARFNDSYQQNSAVKIIYDAPLLIETKAHLKMQKVILVKADLKIIIKRLLQRLNDQKTKISISDLKRRMFYQIKPAAAAKLADFVINGNLDLEGVKKQVVTIAHQLARLPQLTLAQINAILKN